MRRLLVAAVAMSAVVTFGKISSAADSDKGKTETVSGVLIDTKCAAGQMKKDNPEEAAAKHSKSCALKCGGTKDEKGTGYAVISGKKMWKLDDKGNELAAAYLEKHDSTKVTVMGSEEGDQIKVSSIEEKKSDKAKG